MLYRNIPRIIAALSIFTLAAGCTNDTVGSTSAPLVASCEADLVKLTGEWVCPDPHEVECEDGFGDPETIYVVPVMYERDSCDGIELTLEDGKNEAGPFKVQPEPHEITVTAKVPDQDDEVLCESLLTVVDRLDPEPIDEAIELWPPNHKFHTISGEDCVVDKCDGEDVEVTFLSAWSDEPINDKGDGNTDPDIILGCDSVQVRAERQGGGNGRVYTLTYVAVDDAGNGNDTELECVVTVPHDQSGRKAIDDGTVYPDPPLMLDLAVCDDGTGGTGGTGGDNGEGGEGGTGGDVVVL
jgi:hypothetical protein